MLSEVSRLAREVKRVRKELLALEEAFTTWKKECVTREGEIHGYALDVWIRDLGAMRHRAASVDRKLVEARRATGKAP